MSVAWPPESRRMIKHDIARIDSNGRLMTSEVYRERAQRRLSESILATEARRDRLDLWTGIRAQPLILR